MYRGSKETITELELTIMKSPTKYPDVRNPHGPGMGVLLMCALLCLLYPCVCVCV